MKFLSSLTSQIDTAMLVDRSRLRDLARRIEQAAREGARYDRWLEQLRTGIDESCQRRERRERNRPTCTFDPELPITALRTELADAIQKHQVVVVCGETGSGKSTQLPKICLEIGRGIHGLIGHTQPRRIAARSIAARLAEELSSSVGRHVGFKVRFTDVTSSDGYVKLMTDGILLAETQGDPYLEQYDTLIIDEAHERSLNIDFILGYLKRLLPERPDLRVIITSATIDVERFSEHFATEVGPAPVVMVSGRTYPVEVWYRPPQAAEDDYEPDRRQCVLDAVDELVAHDRHGDILIFLATERDILETAKGLRGRAMAGRTDFDVLPLYARLSTQEQNRVFESHSRRRIVLATNVAESSLTVPGIRYVIDTGLARISRYAARSKIQRLPVEPISQASADQRKGRCGRLGPGICVRLYEQDDYEQRDRFTAPEIRRSNLAAVILQAEALGLGTLEEFPFLDPPQPHLIRDGYATLFELGAVDHESRLTPLGEKLSRLPVDPRIGRMILAGMDEGCLPEVLVVAAALEARDARERPADRQQAADEAHARFTDPDSDFLVWLNIWRFYSELREKLSKNQLRKACHQNFLSPTRMREWHDVHLQLQQLVHEHWPEWRTGALGEPPTAKPDRDRWYASIHRAILSGLLSNVALKKEQSEYTGAGNIKLSLWPGSCLFDRKPLWIVAAELVETTRRFARTAARIQPDWIEPLAPHLIDREYAEPHWSSKQLAALAYEKVTLYGLTIASRKLVPYGAVDPEWSRDEFIRHALLEGEWRGPAPFLDHNRQLREQIDRLVAKTRRTDLVVDDFAMMAFYRRQLPADAYDVPRLNRWRRDAERENPRRLFMTLADMTAARQTPRVDDYPDLLTIDRLKLALEYRFEPGAEQDGVTVVLPRSALAHLPPERLDWVVPGQLEEKIVALIRALPKALRRNLVPVPDTARRVVSELKFGVGRFLDEVARILTRIAEEPVTVEALEQVDLPPHCRMNVRVIDEQNKTVKMGRDLDELRQACGVNRAAAGPPEGGGPWHRDGLKSWDFPPLLESVNVRRGGVALTQFPAIVDQGEAVGLRLVDTKEEAATLTRAGVRRLVVIAENRALKTHIDWFPELNQLALAGAGLMNAAELRNELAVLIADRAFVGDRPLPRSADQLQQLLKRGRDQVDVAVRDVVRVVSPLLKNYHGVRLAIDAVKALAPPIVAEVRQQMAELLVKRFLTITPWQWLQHFPRYLEAIRIRLQKVKQGGGARDRQLQTQIAPLVARYQQRRQELERRGRVDPELETYRWLLEEFRVSLFAQQLGTSTPVSVKRLDQQWASRSM